MHFLIQTTTVKKIYRKENHPQHQTSPTMTTTSPHHDRFVIMTLNSWLSYYSARISEHIQLFASRQGTSASGGERTRSLRRGHCLAAGENTIPIPGTVDALIVDVLDLCFMASTCAVYQRIFRVRDCTADWPSTGPSSLASHPRACGRRCWAGWDNTRDRSCEIRGVWSNSSGGG